MIKLKAFLIHFSISAMVILSFLAIVVFVWYPYPYLRLEGGYTIIAILIGVDLILGPTITLIIYKPGKKGLLFDLSFIAAVQISAFIYGAATIYTERPQYIAFLIDRFTLVPASSVNTDKLTDPSLYNNLFNQPKFVYVEDPKDPKRKSELLFETLGSGNDLDSYAEFYRQFDSNFERIINDKHQLLVTKIIETSPAIEKQVIQIEKDFNVSREQLVFYPIKGNDKAMIMVLNKENSRQKAILEMLPYGWSDWSN